MQIKAYAALLGIALLLIASGASGEEFVYMAETVAASAGEQDEVTTGGFTWHCRDNWCVIRAPWPQPDLDACQALARKVGPLASFGLKDGSIALDEKELEKCNGDGSLSAREGVREGVTVLLGTYEWDVDRDRLESTHAADLWLEHVDAGTRQLVPRNGAQIALLGQTNCQAVTPERLAKARFRYTPLVDRDDRPWLHPGTVIAMKTNSRKLAKLCIRGFRNSHDLRFKEAHLLSKEWITMTRQRPVIDRYHLVVSWTIYDDVDPLSLFEAPE